MSMFPDTSDFGLTPSRGRAQLGRRESLLGTRSADTVRLRAIPGSPRGSGVHEGNYDTLIGVLAFADARRRRRPAATGWGRATLSLTGHGRGPSVPQHSAIRARGEGTSDSLRRQMHVRQLSQTVRYGRKITFFIPGLKSISGYLAGMDDEYYYVLSPTADGCDRWNVSKAGSPAFMLHPEGTYDSEQNRAVMEEIIGPFRVWVNNNILGGRSDSDARKAG